MCPAPCDHLSPRSGAPGVWQGLFDHLQGTPTGCSLMAAQEWIHSQTTSGGGLDPSSWADLLQWISVDVPINHEGKLQFRPRLLELEVPTQKAALSLFIQHYDKMAPSDVINLLGAAQPWSASSSSDSWVAQLLQVLREKVQPQQTPTYQFTEKTRGSYSTLLARIKKTEATKPKDPWSALRGGKESQDGTASDSPDVIVLSGTPSPTVEPAGSSSQRSAVTSQRSAMVSQGRPSQAPSLSESFTADGLEADQHVDVLALREIWHTERVDGANVPEQTECLVNMTSQQLEVACSRLHFEKIPESSLPAVCQHIASLGDRLSHTTAVYLATTCLLPRVSSLTQNASRALLGAINVFAVTFSQPTIEGVLVPSLTEANSGSPQADLAARVIKEVFKSQNRIDLFSKLVHGQQKWNETVLSVLQTLLDVKTEVAGPLLSEVVERLQQVATDLSGSTKLAKVVLTLVQKHGKQLTVAQGAGLKQVLQKNTTFLRKPALAALSRLKI